MSLDRIRDLTKEEVEELPEVALTLPATHIVYSDATGTWEGCGFDNLDKSASSHRRFEEPHRFAPSPGGIEGSSPRLVGRRMYRFVRPTALDGTAGCSVPRASTSSTESSSRMTPWRRLRRNGALRVCELSFLPAGGPGPSPTSAGRTKRSSSTVTRPAYGHQATRDGAELPSRGTSP